MTFSVEHFKRMVNTPSNVFFATYFEENSDREDVKIAAEIHKISSPVQRNQFIERVIASRSRNGGRSIAKHSHVQDSVIQSMLDEQKKLLEKKVPAPEPDTRAFKHSSRPLFQEKREDVKQVGRTRTAEVEVREDQSDFKRRISLNFGGKCAVMGHDTAATLQAAHIQPFADERNNNTSNGILLDVLLHVLFDRGLMVINPDDLTVHFNCYHPVAELYEGKKIATPKVALDVEALRIHFNRFN